MKKILYGVFATLLLTTATFGQTLMSDEDHRIMMHTYEANVNAVLAAEGYEGMTLDQFKRNIITGVLPLSGVSILSILNYVEPLKTYGAQFAAAKGIPVTTEPEKIFLSGFAPSTAISGGFLVENTTSVGLTAVEMWTCAIRALNPGQCAPFGVVGGNKNNIKSILGQVNNLANQAGMVGVAITVIGFGDCVNSFIVPIITDIPLQEVADTDPEIIESLNNLLSKTEPNEYVIDSTSVTKMTTYNGINYTFTVIPEADDTFCQNIVIQKGWGGQENNFLMEYQLNTSVQQIGYNGIGNHILNTNIYPIQELPVDRNQVSVVGSYVLECNRYGAWVDVVNPNAPPGTSGGLFQLIPSIKKWVLTAWECVPVFRYRGSSPDEYAHLGDWIYRGFPIYRAPSVPSPVYNFVSHLSPPLKSYWDNAPTEIKEGIKNYLDQKGDMAFATWSLEYLKSHSGVTWTVFNNQFMGTSEGKDGDYDAVYWNNPNLTFPQQNLPTYNAYYNGMARFSNGKLMTGADNVYGLVGGKVLQARIADPDRTENTCALKVSIALNRAGIVIPKIEGQTVEGGGTEFTGKYFFLNAKALNSWMRETFGTNPASTTTPYNANHISYTGSQGGTKGENFPDLLKGKKAIYSMITTNQYNTETSTSGHADLLFTDSTNQANCAYGCFFNLPIERIDIWILN